MTFSRALLALSACLLAACTLIDQNTFDPNAGAAPVVAALPKPLAPATPAGPPPLVVIDSKDPLQYLDPLRRAVAAARARKPDVMFDVVEIQPPGADPDPELGAAAARVARTIMAEGIPASQVQLLARPEPDGKPGEVRVYVR